MDGALKLKYHTFPFARKTPTWKVPTCGSVADILAARVLEIGLGGASPGEGVPFLHKSCKMVRLTQKTPCPPAYQGFRGSIQPILGRILQDTVDGGDPGAGRRVARRVLGGIWPKRQAGLADAGVLREVRHFHVSRIQCVSCKLTGG